MPVAIAACSSGILQTAVPKPSSGVDDRCRVIVSLALDNVCRVPSISIALRGTCANDRVIKIFIFARLASLKCSQVALFSKATSAMKIFPTLRSE